MTISLENLYQVAARAGLLVECLWQPSDGALAQSHSVGFTAPDKEVLSGLGLSTEYEIRYPTSYFADLKAAELVQIAGVRYQVREVLAIGDGAEMRASLMRL